MVTEGKDNNEKKGEKGRKERNIQEYIQHS